MLIIYTSLSELFTVTVTGVRARKQYNRNLLVPLEPYRVVVKSSRPQKIFVLKWKYVYLLVLELDKKRY